MRIKSFAALAACALVINAHGADKVKIGFISTLSGPSAAIGVDIRDAFMLAVKVNGGKLGGLPAEVLIGDDQFKPDVGRQLAEKYVKADKVNFLTGIVFSNIMLASVPMALESKIIYVSPNAAPSPMAGKECNPYLFVASWPNDAYHEAAGQHATNRGYKNMYLIAPNYQAGKDSLTGFKRYYKGQIVAAFEQEYKRLPTVFAAQGWDTAMLIDAAVRDTKGKIEDVEAVRKAMKAAKFDSVRGNFKFNKNHMPIQNYYLRVVARDGQGRLVNKTIGTVFKDHGDAYVQDCKMK